MKSDLKIKLCFLTIFSILVMSNSWVLAAPVSSIIPEPIKTQSGLQYFGQRYYNDTLGRFTTIDPLVLKQPEKFLADPQQLNSYSYGRNNPVRYVDPTGLANQEFQPYYSSGISYEHGDLLGSYRRINVRSGGIFSGSDENDYQCVDLVKDFAYSEHGYIFGRMYEAINFSKPEYYSTSNSHNLNGEYIVYQNGSANMPQEDDIITWSGGPHGHVGIISEVVFDNQSGTGQVYTIEQNSNANRAVFSQSLTRSYNQKGQAIYTVGNHELGLQTQSWSRYSSQSVRPGYERYSSGFYTPATKNYIYLGQ